MPYENTSIASTRGATRIVGYREDLVAGETVTLALTDTLPAASEYRWEILGRPEGSTAGGAGPEPISLGASATASFVVDTDAGYAKDGTYKIQCTFKAGTTERRTTALLVRLSPVTMANGLKLRHLAACETAGDTSVTTVRSTYATMFVRWLQFLDQSARYVGAPDVDGFRISNAINDTYTGVNPDRVYINLGWGGCDFQSSTGPGTSVAGQIKATGIPVAKAGIFKSFLWYRAGGTAGGDPRIRIALYSNKTKTNYPDALLWDSGDVQVPTTGRYVITCNLAVPPGLYWLAWQVNADYLSKSVTTNVGGYINAFGCGQFGYANAGPLPGETRFIYGYNNNTGTFVAFPATWPSVISQVLLNCCVIGFRWGE